PRPRLRRRRLTAADRRAGAPRADRHHARRGARRPRRRQASLQIAKGERMALKGYTVPRTPNGDASLVPSPPWHYVADFVVVDFHADPEAAASLLPEGIEPHPDP